MKLFFFFVLFCGSFPAVPLGLKFAVVEFIGEGWGMIPIVSVSLYVMCLSCFFSGAYLYHCYLGSRIPILLGLELSGAEVT